MTSFSPGIERALRTAIAAHEGQTRKGTVTPYITHPLHVAMLLARAGADEETIQAIKHAFHLLFNSRLRLQDALKRVREEIPASPEVNRLLSFLEESQRGVCR